MAETHPVFQASHPIYSSCLETKMASLKINHESPQDGDRAKGGLINGKFDIDSLLAELTTEEKVSLLAGIVATYLYCGLLVSNA